MIVASSCIGCISSLVSSGMTLDGAIIYPDQPIYSSHHLETPYEVLIASYLPNVVPGKNSKHALVQTPLHRYARESSKVEYTIMYL